MDAELSPGDTKVVEAAIAERHLLEIGYRDAEGRSASHLIEPYAFRTNRARHRVLWAWDREHGHVEEFRVTGLQSVRDTGELFPPRDWAPPT